MVEKAAAEKSLRAVVEAHEVLKAFHAEVVALFQIVDEQFGDDSARCTLTPHSPSDVVFTTTVSTKRYPEWVPSWFGRLYYDERLQVSDGEEETLDSRAAAAVMIFSGDPRSPSECWFGVGRPGEGTKYKDSRDFARNGFWNYVFEPPAMDGWSRGVFAGNSYFGGEARWSMRRIRLADLTTVDRVRDLVTRPLQDEWVAMLEKAQGR